MIARVRRCALSAALLLSLTSAAAAQQVVQRGALGTPSQMLDETGNWSTPLPVGGDAAATVYIPDVSTTPWLQRNYADFSSRGVYHIAMLTFYRRNSACRQDLTRWGFADAAHLDACIDIGYRLRQLEVDITQHTLTLLGANMVSQDGVLLAEAAAPQSVTRRWADLDPAAFASLTQTNKIVADQMLAYDRRLSRLHQ